MKKNNGITLIALVITIIVLLILAGVSISAITGENGIVEKAKIAKEATRAGEIQEAINLALAENEIQEATNGDYKTKTEIIAELVSSKKITAEEAETLKSSDVITIGNVGVDFTELAEYTIKFTIYDRARESDIEYEAEKGKTWGEWIESIYNVDGYTQPNEREFSVVDSTKEYWVTEDWDGNNHQGLDDYIMANHAYIQWQYGELPRDNSIRFTIEGVQYIAEPGMTWDEWIETGFNNNGYTRHDEDGILVDSTKEYWITEDENGSNHQYLTDVIQAGADYYHYNYGETPGGESL